MPELPEVETIAREVHARVAGGVIASVTVRKPDVLRFATPRRLRQRVTGATIARCWRRAKLAILDLSTGDRIAVQPRFTGALLVDDGTLAAGELEYSTLDFGLEDGRRLHYRDVRRLGTVALFTPERFAEYESGLGVEPLDPAFTAAHLSGLLRGSRQAVKKVIMDQRRLAGVGNIYANEALWRAGIDPSRSADSVPVERIEPLHEGIVSVLQEAIEARGTSFRDYRDASGEPGEFVQRLAVYGRAGEPCRRCGARLVGTHEVDGRQTVLCARCQR